MGPDLQSQRQQTLQCKWTVVFFSSHGVILSALFLTSLCLSHLLHPPIPALPLYLHHRPSKALYVNEELSAPVLSAIKVIILS